MDKKIYELINDQINKELYSAYLYLEIADYYKDAGLDGYANFYEIQAKEERDHALIFRKYLLENDETPKLLAIDAPNETYSDFLAPLKKAYEHEQYVTSLINGIYALAEVEHDYATRGKLDWFISEQVEEEETARGLIDRLKLIGENGMALYMLDQELAARVFNVPAPLANA